MFNFKNIKEIRVTPRITFSSRLRVFCWLICGVVLFTQIGCSWLFGDSGRFRDRANDYQQARSATPLDIPSDLKPKQIISKYPVPGVGTDSASFFSEVPRPSSMVLVFGQGDVTLKRVKTEDWLYLRHAPEPLGQALESFLKAQDVAVELREPNELISQWVAVPKSELKKGFFRSTWRVLTLQFLWPKKTVYQRYRMQFQAQALGEAEEARVLLGWQRVELSDMNKLKEGSKLIKDLVWSYQPMEDELLSVLLTDLADYLTAYGSGEQKGETIRGLELSLEKDGNGYPVLSINRRYAQAWEKVKRALKKTQIKIDDLDRSLGVFYVRLSGEVLSEVLVSQSNVSSSVDLDVELTEERKKKTGNKAVKKESKKEKEISEQREFKNMFEVRMINAESGVLLSVQESDEKLAPKEVSEIILGEIKRAYLKKPTN